MPSGSYRARLQFGSESAHFAAGRYRARSILQKGNDRRQYGPDTVPVSLIIYGKVEEGFARKLDWVLGMGTIGVHEVEPPVLDQPAHRKPAAQV